MFEASVLFIFGKLAEKLRMLNSFIQQGFRPWCKVNWMENLLKCGPAVDRCRVKPIWYSVSNALYDL